MIRILMAKMGEGRAEIVMRLAKAFRDAGWEVIYTEIQRPENIVASAIQEAIDHISITAFPGADLGQIARLRKLLVEEGMPQIQITVSGYANAGGAPALKEAGITEVFPAGTTNGEIVAWARQNVKCCYN
jgi:methylmalonyl-CoA mutase C-terminal domain/subunit